ncbi:MAG: CRISPR-associated protein Cas8a1/Csx13, partial [Thermogemmata sp.]|nr:CRISPR-associated protein Cas8a1/Csx13 [Thermogemmata sp.]
PVSNDQFPWTIEPQQVTLYFGQPENTRNYLCKLFQFAFQICEGVIYLPGQYPEISPSLSVRAALQEGLILSYFDHGPSALKIKEKPTTQYIEIDSYVITFTITKIEWFKHQDGADIVVKSFKKPQPVNRTYYPGVIVKHQAYGDTTAIVHNAEYLLPLLFAPIGTFALRMGYKRVRTKNKRIPKSGAVVVIPDICDLTRAAEVMQSIIPQNLNQTAVGSVGDAILGAEIRLRARRLLDPEIINSIRAIWCCSTDWNQQLQQMNNVFQVDQDSITDKALDRYERSCKYLWGFIKKNKKNMKNKTNVKDKWMPSIVRPLVAENLARGRPWYAGFVNLMIKINPANGKPYRKQIPLEKGGLYAMVNDPQMWDSEGEKLMVQAVHEAIYRSLGRIKDETDGPGVPPSDATRGRWKNFWQKRRLELVGAKTEEQARFALTNLFSRAGNNEVLRQHWEAVLEVMRRDWRLARDLGLLALASYQGRGEENEDDEEEDNSDELPRYQSVTSE